MCRGAFHNIRAVLTAALVTDADKHSCWRPPFLQSWKYLFVTYNCQTAAPSAPLPPPSTPIMRPAPPVPAAFLDQSKAPPGGESLSQEAPRSNTPPTMRPAPRVPAALLDQSKAPPGGESLSQDAPRSNTPSVAVIAGAAAGAIVVVAIAGAIWLCTRSKRQIAMPGMVVTEPYCTSTIFPTAAYGYTGKAPVQPSPAGGAPVARI